MDACKTNCDSLNISGLLGRNDAGLETLENDVQKLGSRLGPILNPARESPDGDGAPPQPVSESDLAVKLCEQYQRIVTLTSLIQVLLSRLDV